MSDPKLFEEGSVYRLRYPDGSYHRKLYRKKGHARSAKAQIEYHSTETLMIEEMSGVWLYAT